MAAFREEVRNEDNAAQKKKLDTQGYKASHGYGGKFGVEQDRMDKSAVGHDYQEKLGQHASQKDYAKGFGGKYGVQNDRKDKVWMTSQSMGTLMTSSFCSSLPWVGTT